MMTNIPNLFTFLNFCAFQNLINTTKNKCKHNIYLKIKLSFSLANYEFITDVILYIFIYNNNNNNLKKPDLFQALFVKYILDVYLKDEKIIT